MNPYRSLIIDDEVLARQAIRTLLQTVPDFTVVDEAANGTEAVLKVLQQKPDLIFLDIQMPGLNGLEVAAQLEQETAPLIVFVTAYDEHAVKAFDLNAVALPDMSYSGTPPPIPWAHDLWLRDGDQIEVPEKQ